ncbi:hypothetical protein [Paenibacillus sp. MBLB4367]|uniref:hypothetical protein n=1 Tax=Paenibacillus sp. MBLB4367 TaxID=3384767 RepID=UPI0039083B5D
MIVTAGNQKDDLEMKKYIESIGGRIIHIEEVDSESTPFLPIHRRFGKHYKIQYSRNGKEHVGWFRGDRAFIQSPEPSSSEKWILD